MSVPLPARWLEHLPKILVVGDGIYARALTQILKRAELLTEQMLLEGVEHPSDKEGPFSQVKSIIMVLADGESAHSFLWKHKRLWFMLIEEYSSHELLRNLAANWVLIAADDEQKRQFADADLLGRSTTALTFDKWNQGYRLVSRRTGLAVILTALENPLKVPFSHWKAVIDSDETPRNLQAFRDYLSRTHDPLLVARQIPKLKSLIPIINVEWYFPLPQQHSLGNEMRRWLAVTQPDTPWLQQGRILFAKLNL